MCLGVMLWVCVSAKCSLAVDQERESRSSENQSQGVGLLPLAAPPLLCVSR